MKIYENEKGEKFVEKYADGERRYVEDGEWFADMGEKPGACLKSSALYPAAIYGRYDAKRKILRPATPEEIKESEGKKPCGFSSCPQHGWQGYLGEKCPQCEKEYFERERYGQPNEKRLTLPLSVGQIVVCRDGVERTVERLASKSAMYVEGGGVYAEHGKFNWDWKTETKHLDAIADSPRWKPEKKDEKLHTCGGCKQYTPVDGPCPVCAKEKQARAAVTAKSSDAKVGNEGLSRSSAPSPQAAPPAILDTCACCHGQRTIEMHGWFEGNKAILSRHDTPLRGGGIGYVNMKHPCPECNAPKPEAPKPDTRPDIEQRDARSDEFVARKWVGTIKG